MSSLSRYILLPTLTILSTAACESAPQAPDCEGDRCDEVSPESTSLLSCWIEESESDDDFFRLDKLHCSYHPESSFLDVTSVSIDVTMADGKRGSVFFRSDNSGTDMIVAGIRSGGFPLELNIQTTLDFSDRNDELIGIDSLRQTRQTLLVPGIADATRENPLQISHPFEVMELDMFNRHFGEARLEFNHEIVVDDSSIVIDEVHQIIAFGLRDQLKVAVSTGAESIGSTIVLRDNSFSSSEVGRYESVFRGSGEYEISLESTRQIDDTELVEPEGHPMALCRLLTNSVIPPESCTTDCEPTVTHSFHCFGNPAPGVEENRHLHIIPAVPAGETAMPIDVDFVADGEVSVALEASQLPAIVEVHSTLDESVSGLRGLASQIHIARQRVSIDQEIFNAFLPFKLWTVEIEASEELIFARLQVDPRVLELGYQWPPFALGQQFALEIQDDSDLSSQPNSPASFVIAVPADVNSIAGSLEIVDQQATITNLPLEFTSGRWLASSEGLTALD